MAVQHDGLATKEDLDQLKQELIAKIDSNGKKIGANSAKIEANGVKIDDVEKRLSWKIDANGGKIDANAASIHRLTAQVTKNGEAIKETLTREEYKKDYNKLLRGQDEMMVVLLRIDQERAATNARISRVEEDVETNMKGIKSIRTKLSMET